MMKPVPKFILIIALSVVALPFATHAEDNLGQADLAQVIDDGQMAPLANGGSLSEAEGTPLAPSSDGSEVIETGQSSALFEQIRNRNEAMELTSDDSSGPIQVDSD